MAQSYDSIGDLSALTTPSSGIDAATATAIAGILGGLAAGTEIAGATQTEDVGREQLADITSPVVVMDGTGKFDATIPADSPIKAIITAAGVGSNNITFSTDDNVAVQLNGGANDKVTTAGGDDTVVFRGASTTNASAVIDTGAGNDTVVLTPLASTNNGGTADVSTGAGNDTVNWTGGWTGSATIDTGEGSDTVMLEASKGGEASISTGAGGDTVTLTSWEGQATIDTGSGNDRVNLGLSSGMGDSSGTQADIALGTGNDIVWMGNGWEGQATIDGGEGFDRLQTPDSRSSHTISYQDGHFVMNSAGVTLDNVNVLEFGQRFDGVTTTPSSITVFADSAGDAIVAKLYQVALGREAIDNAYGTNGLGGDDAIRGPMGGLAYWTEVFNGGNNSANLQQTVYAFLGSGEFANLYNGMDDETFVTQLFHNLDKADNHFRVLTEINGKTVQDYVNQLDGSNEARWNVVWEIASSAETVQILGQDGNQYIIQADGINDGPQSA